MRLRLMTIAGGLLLAASSGSACAMTTPKTALTCTVSGGDKLPSETGGPEALCKAIRAAAGDKGHGASVAVRIASAYSAAASVTLADGRTLPDVNVSISDRTLNRRSIEMLAQGVARQLAGTR